MKCSQFRHAAAGLAILAAVSLLAPTGARAEVGSAAAAAAATPTAIAVGGGLLWDEGWNWAATLMSQLRQLVLGGAPRPPASAASPARQARQAAGASRKSTATPPSRDVTTSVDPTGNNASNETYPTINPDGLQ
jgi:hypothetical protein